MLDTWYHALRGDAPHEVSIATELPVCCALWATVSVGNCPKGWVQEPFGASSGISSPNPSFPVRVCPDPLFPHSRDTTSQKKELDNEELMDVKSATTRGKKQKTAKQLKEES